jgi:hypothetical protein
MLKLDVYVTVRRALFGLLTAVAIAGPASATTHAEYIMRLYGPAPAAFERGDFATLEAWAETFRDPSLAARNGYAYSVDFYRSIWRGVDCTRADAVKRAWRGTFTTWQAAHPKSPTPYLAHSAMLIRLTCQYPEFRPGTELAGSLAKIAMDNLSEAHALLLEYQDIATVDYAWYAMMFDLEIRMGFDKGQALTHLVAGLARFPSLTRFYVLGADALAPKRDGSWSLFNGWVETAVKNTRQTGGLAVYAEIYAQLMQHVVLYHQPALSARHWSLLQKGMADLERYFPHIDYDGVHAKLACSAFDERVVRLYLGRMVLKNLIPAALADDADEFCGWTVGRTLPYGTKAIPLPSID